MGEDSKILFLCTGNYYRSRFAESLFNHLVHHSQVRWKAESRGLRLSSANAGPISLHALSGLKRLGVELGPEQRFPLAATEQDFVEAHRIIALKRTEHLSLIKRQFPTWPERVEFWTIDDLDCAGPEEALTMLEEKIRRLVLSLA